MHNIALIPLWLAYELWNLCNHFWRKHKENQRWRDAVAGTRTKEECYTTEGFKAECARSWELYQCSERVPEKSDEEEDHLGSDDVKMRNNQIEIGQAYWDYSGTRQKCTVEMYHQGLNERKFISAPDIDRLNDQVNLQSQKWAIIESLKQIDSLLVHTLSIDARVDWESLKKKEKYQEKSTFIKPTKKSKKEYPPPPVKQSAEWSSTRMISRRPAG